MGNVQSSLVEAQLLKLQGEKRLTTLLLLPIKPTGSLSGHLELLLIYYYYTNYYCYTMTEAGS